MSDDSKNLPSWLQDDDDEPEDKTPPPEGDEETPEWLQDDEDQPSQQPGKLGFTGELPWLQQFGDQPDAVERAEQNMFDWQTDESGGESEPADEGKLPSWVFEAGEPDATMPDAPSIPSWLTEESDETSGEEEVHEVEQLWGDQLPEDFLAKADDLADSFGSEQTYDEWAAEQERLRRGPDLEEETPDLLSDIAEGGTGSLPPADSDAPTWVLGLEELDDADALDFLAEPKKPTNELPSWMSGLEEEIPSAPVQPKGEFDDDFFANLGLATGGETPRQPSVEDEEPLDLSWLEDSDSRAASEATSEDMVDEDFFQSLGLSAAPQQPQAAEPESGGDEFDFSWLDQGEAQETPQDAVGIRGSVDDATAAMLQAEREEEPDFSWLDQGEVAEPETEAMDDDLMAALGLASDQPAPEADEEPSFDMSWLDETPDEQPAAQAQTQPESLNDDDFFAQFGIEDEGQPEEQAEEETFRFDFDTEAEAGEPDWLQQTAQQAASIAPSDDELDVLFSLPDEPVPPRPSTVQPQPAPTGIEDFLASLGSEPPALPTAGDLLEQPDFDIDQLFSQVAFTELEPEPKPFRELPPREDISSATAEFLRDLEANVGEVSAAALVRQRKDRPLEELPDRLQQLHDRAEQLPQTGQLRGMESDALTNILPDVVNTLSPAQITTGLPGIAGAVSLSEEQKARVDLLRAVIGAEEAPAPDTDYPYAIEQTYQEEELDLESEFEVAPPPTAPYVPPPVPIVTKKPRRGRIQIDRIVIAVVLAVAVIAPFFTRFLWIGGLPPAAFVPGSSASAAFGNTQALNEGDLVLVGIEYGPTAAAELDGLTEALLRHILARGGRPVLVGGNPVGLLHASNILDGIAAANPTLRANRDYYVTQFLAGSAIGLRSLGEDTASWMLSDIRGESTNLGVGSLADFRLLVVIADQPEEIRGYIEQLAPLTVAPLVVATNYASAPLVEPYLSLQGIGGMLVGYRDAYTYLSMLGIPGFPPPVLVTPTLPLPEITPEPLAATEEATAQPTEAETQATEAPTEAPTERPTREPISAPTEEAPTEAPDIVSTQPATTQAPTTVSTQTATTGPSLDDQLATLNAFRTGTASFIAATAQAIRTEAASTVAAITEQFGEPATEQPSVTVEPTEANTNAPRPTNTSRSTNAPAATETSEFTPTATRTPLPTRTPTDTPEPSETPFESITGFVASNQTVNVRSGPGTSYSVIGSVPSRNEVQIMGLSDDGAWYRILIPGTEDEGWVSAALIRLPTPTPEDGAWDVKQDVHARRLPEQQIDAQATLDAALTLAAGSVPAGAQATLDAAQTLAAGNLPAGAQATLDAAQTLAAGNLPADAQATLDAAQTLGAGNLPAGAQATLEAAQTLGAGHLLGAGNVPAGAQETLDAAQTLGAGNLPADAQATLDAAQTLAAGNLPAGAQATLDAAQTLAAGNLPAGAQATLEAAQTLGAGNLPAGAQATLAAAQAAAGTLVPAFTEPDVRTLAAVPVPYHDERWYAMTMGILASSIIITIGMVANLTRGLLRRRRGR